MKRFLYLFREPLKKYLHDKTFFTKKEAPAFCLISRHPFSGNKYLRSLLLFVKQTAVQIDQTQKQCRRQQPAKLGLQQH